MIRRGSIWWADLREARGSKPAKRRAVLVIQSGPYNDSRLNTTIAAVITSNTGLAAMPGNVFLPAASSGLRKDSVVNVTAMVTVDKDSDGLRAHASGRHRVRYAGVGRRRSHCQNVRRGGRAVMWPLPTLPDT